MEQEFASLSEEIDEEPDEDIETVEVRGRRRNRSSFEYRIEGDSVIGGRNRRPFRM